MTNAGITPPRRFVALGSLLRENSENAKERTNDDKADAGKSAFGTSVITQSSYSSVSLLLLSRFRSFAFSRSFLDGAPATAGLTTSAVIPRMAKDFSQPGIANADYGRHLAGPPLWGMCIRPCLGAAGAALRLNPKRRRGRQADAL